MQPSRLTIARFGSGWAIKHNGGFLGAVGSEQEARNLAQRIVAMSNEDGRSPGLALAENGAEPGSPQRRSVVCEA
jgi:hypothetical protein